MPWDGTTTSLVTNSVEPGGNYSESKHPHFAEQPTTYVTNLHFAQIPVDGLVIGVQVILNLLGVQLNDNYDLLTNTKTVLYRLLMAVYSFSVSSFSCLFS